MATPNIFTAASAASISFGTTDETDIIVTSYSRTANAEKTEVRNGENEVVAVAYSGKTADINIAGFTNGTVAVAVATALSLTNDTTLGGLTGGTVLTDTVAFSTSQGEFQQVTISATQYSESLSEV